MQYFRMALQLQALRNSGFCIDCTHNGWIKFVAAEYLPLTVNFMLIIVFGESAAADNITW